MKKTLLYTVLPFAALFSQVHAAPLDVPQATIVSESKGGGYTPDNQLYTESAWQSVIIPEVAMSKLGTFKNIQLAVVNMPNNVHFKLLPQEAPGQVGLSIWRTNKTQRVGQVGLFTLTNPVTHFSYTFQAMVMGAGT
ncbi:hypothetical protein HNQ07_004198 [Deinococcus metalli]|uniref:Uncharacterized protein n=1 Tax=Deinococcus metalli TaxID=1141878 RepID=A0A7W8KKK0_9DEIO|nr:hypothetical protein [Deinococcus metalli]MBB5378691.1 hypothetical protein [Deinococcus metalli]GHF61736.1 hypothetical protein GCM10017781_42380 [Deinococcus metalli]